MRLKSVARLITVTTLLTIASVHNVSASNTTCMGSIDAIDIVFPSGGGTYNGSFSNGADDDWIVFSATAGDALVLTGNSTDWVNAVLLQDTGDGDFQVGDTVGVCNFNINNMGLGSPLTILTPNTAWGNTFNAFGNGSLDTLNFVATYTGQYALALAVNNSDDAQAGTYTVTLAGNNAVPAVPPVPVPAIGPPGLLLLGLLLALIGFSRVRRRT